MKQSYILTYAGEFGSSKLLKIEIEMFFNAIEYQLLYKIYNVPKLFDK